MKNKVFYMSMLLMCIMTSCGDDNAPPIPAPTLSIDPATALHFTAAATESHEINVTTNQDSWTAISNQNWCKVTQDKNKLIVKADPNTTETSPRTGYHYYFCRKCKKHNAGSNTGCSYKRT